VQLTGFGLFIVLVFVPVVAGVAWLAARAGARVARKSLSFGGEEKRSKAANEEDRHT
jgi:hypothetical protein